MLEVQKDIVGWLHQQPDWMQSAAEKLMESDALSEADLGSLVSHLKSEEGWKVTSHRPFDQLAAPVHGTGELRLLAMGHIRGIENLSPRTPLGFGSGNLAVIYGPNGSGKSGYNRILKKACGKPRAVDLKTNVFQDPPPSRGCQISYQVGSVKHEPDWSPDGAALTDLRPIDIFDAETAVFYLNKESEASYTPPMVALFENLAKVCDAVKAKLQSEQSALVSKLPGLPPEFAGTPIAKTFVALKHDIKPEALKQLTLWSEEDQALLDRVTERLKVADPATSAKQKRSAKLRLEQLIVQIREASGALGVENLASIREARQEAKLKRRLSAEAAKIQTDSAELQGIGTDTWHALWKAARAFSLIPYPDQDFPVTEEDSRCVLCHQILEPDAQQRMRDFEAFVQGTIESEAKAAEKVYTDLLTGLPVALTSEDVRTRCTAAGITDDAGQAPFLAFWVKVAMASEGLKGGEADGEVAPIPLPADLLSALTVQAEALEKEALQHDQDAQDFDRAQAVQEKTELEARRWVSQQSDAIVQELTRLKTFAVFDQWIRKVNPRNVSTQAGEVAAKVITDAYVKRFNQELAALGATRIKVELVKTRTEKGRALHKITLKDAKNAQIGLDAVLSEGERRIVALAAFLADVADKPFAAPFVFDDPISSLDHEFEWSVAMRLAKLAKDRQVLVFTHRLSLFGAMQDAARKLSVGDVKITVSKRLIESFNGSAGQPAHEEAWACRTPRANEILIQNLNVARDAGAAGGSSAYKPLAQAVCTEFRKLLERSIEEDLLHGIVRRHRRKLTTESLLAKLPTINPEDCRLLEDLMTKYSCYEHSHSDETPVFIPEEPELRQDLLALQLWRTEFKKRGDIRV